MLCRLLVAIASYLCSAYEIAKYQYTLIEQPFLLHYVN